MDDEEVIIWEGRPSHVKDLGYHLLCLVLAPLIVPLALMLRRYLDTRYHRYGITNERLRISKGIFSRERCNSNSHRAHQRNS